MRTPEIFIEEMLKKGRDWIDIDVNASAIRNGAWRDQVRKILLEKRLMPESISEQIKLKEERIKTSLIRNQNNTNQKLEIEKEKRAKDKILKQAEAKS